LVAAAVSDGAASDCAPSARGGCGEPDALRFGFGMESTNG
jgi:hypothetical protein